MINTADRRTTSVTQVFAIICIIIVVPRYVQLLQLILYTVNDCQAIKQQFWENKKKMIQIRYDFD